MKNHRRTAGFTLVEVLVVAGLLVVLMTVLFSMTSQTQRLITSTSSKVEQFQQARVAFESMTRKLAQATLNSFWDYDYLNPNTNTIDREKPYRYMRNAELRFRSGQMLALTGGVAANGNLQPGHGVFFNAPFGYVANPQAYIDLNATDAYNLSFLDNLINAWGYFVEISDDSASLPTFIQTGNLVPARKRYRLMELMQGAENLAVYTPTAQAPLDKSWFDKFVTGTGLPNGFSRPVRALADNIVALVVLPRLSKSDEDYWMANKPSTTPPPLTYSNSSPGKGYGYDSSDFSGGAAPLDPALNPRNQMPPVVQVVMIAIDEPSAARLQDQFGSDPKLGLDYSDLFLEPPTNQTTNNKTKLLDDIATFESRLVARRASYRIFTTNVSIRGAKWSKEQIK